jgi:hypothetical protein
MIMAMMARVHYSLLRNVTFWNRWISAVVLVVFGLLLQRTDL